MGEVSGAVNATSCDMNYIIGADARSFSAVGTFVFTLSWLALYTPGCNLREAFWGINFFSFSIPGLCALRWCRLACLADALLPTWAKLSGILMSAFVSLCTFLHVYIHTTLFWMALRVAEVNKWDDLGVLLFVPVFVLELCIIYYNFQASRLSTRWEWSRQESVYYAVLVSCALALAGGTMVAGETIVTDFP